MKKIFFLFFIFFIIGLVYVNINLKEESFQTKRENIISEMEKLIQEQVELGNYSCCIQPACTMCFMGNWLWDDGMCRCDEMIATGQDDKVCPQCVKALEEGVCESTENEEFSACEVLY